MPGQWDPTRSSQRACSADGDRHVHPLKSAHAAEKPRTLPRPVVDLQPLPCPLVCQGSPPSSLCRPTFPLVVAETLALLPCGVVPGFRFAGSPNLGPTGPCLGLAPGRLPPSRAGWAEAVVGLPGWESGVSVRNRPRSLEIHDQ